MSFKTRYRDLEMQVYSALRSIIEQSGYTPKDYSQPAIPIQYEDYTDLAIINDRLVLLDDRGLQYDVFEIRLEDLIDIYENYLYKSN